MAATIVADFNDKALFEILGTTGASRYAFDYLAELKAQSFLVENHYVDRHYLDDFRTYYARSFDTPDAHCQRLHFFALTTARLNKLVDEVYRSLEARAAAEEELQAGYLGFIVRRPLVGARIGRTVLKTYPVEGKRHYNVVRPYNVHIGGLRLRIEGLAYQQQDRGAAVCASTALWSALQRVAFVAGHRTPTPSAITEAAGSPFPASQGLDTTSMARALAKLGYVADLFTPADNRALFRAKVAACVDSQLPVILLLMKRVATPGGFATSAHAITVTGYSEPEGVAEIPLPTASSKPVPPFRSRSATLSTLYVHDDNLGSHAHYELFDTDDVGDDGNKKLMLKRGFSKKPPKPWWVVDDWVVYAALVPKPDKMRLPLHSLFLVARWMYRSFQNQAFSDVPNLNASTWFATGVEYRRALLTKNLEKGELRKFHDQLRLPRHVGVLELLDGTTHLCDVLLDCTEVERQPNQPTMLAIIADGIPPKAPAMKVLQNVAKQFDLPLIGSPRSGV